MSELSKIIEGVIHEIVDSFDLTHLDEHDLSHPLGPVRVLNTAESLHGHVMDGDKIYKFCLNEWVVAKNILLGRNNDEDDIDEYWIGI